MIKNSDIEQYRQIKAPAELRERVLSVRESTQSKKLFPRFMQSYKVVSAAAACLLILLVSVVLLRGTGDGIEVYIDDTSVANVSRSFSPYVAVVISSEDEVDISTDSEGLFIYSSGELVPLKSIKNVNNETEIIWQVSDEDAVIKVDGQKYKVSYSSEDQKVNVKKIK